MANENENVTVVVDGKEISGLGIEKKQSNILEEIDKIIIATCKKQVEFIEKNGLNKWSDEAMSALAELVHARADISREIIPVLVRQ